MTVKDIEGVSIEIDGVDFMRGKCFDEVFHNHPVHSVAPYSAENPARMNYHFRMFRAISTKATLSVSDWVSKEALGEPIGQQLMFNYVQVEPYFRN